MPKLKQKYNLSKRQFQISTPTSNFKIGIEFHQIFQFSDKGETWFLQSKHGSINIRRRDSQTFPTSLKGKPNASKNGDIYYWALAYWTNKFTPAPLVPIYFASSPIAYAMNFICTCINSMSGSRPERFKWFITSQNIYVPMWDCLCHWIIPSQYMTNHKTNFLTRAQVCGDITAISTLYFPMYYIWGIWILVFLSYPFITSIRVRPDLWYGCLSVTLLELFEEGLELGCCHHRYCHNGSRPQLYFS